ncbi:Fatty acid oxidation complex subunit alpha [Streptomyces violarus]
MAIKRNLRRIETLGKPVVAALNGAALGGGYEIALACHHHVALDAPGSKIGCPEVTLGLLPGGGGVVRTVRLLGIADALLKVLLQGTQYNPRRALENGLVDEVADAQEDMLRPRPAPSSTPTPSPQQPWDKPGYKIPGGTPASPSSRPTCPPSRPRCASRRTAPPTRPRATSSPRPSRAPRSTSRPPRSSRPATSWNSRPGRRRRT